jgi:tRNA-splicing ligase RtcB
MKVDTSGKVPIKMWLQDIEAGALIQAQNLSNLPFVFKHVALMPDCHQGYGMPIGGVLATESVIIPNCVGVDIGCGMIAMKTNLTDISQDQLKTIMGEIRKVIPVGFNHQKQKQDKNLMPTITGENGKQYPFSPKLAEVEFNNPLPIIKQEYENALTQLGTLGGGNHFIEIQKGSDG